MFLVKSNFVITSQHIEMIHNSKWGSTHHSIGLFECGCGSNLTTLKPKLGIQIKS